MSGLSLREARTKRQKAKVYKTSRSEFRSSLNPARNENTADHEDPDQGDDKMLRRKIMKVDGKGMGEEDQGEASVDVNKLNEDEPMSTVTKEEQGSNKDVEESEENKTAEEETKDEETEGENNDQKKKKDEKKDDGPEDDGGNDDINMKEGDGNEDGDEDHNDVDDGDDSSQEGEHGEDNNKSDQGNDKNNDQEDKVNVEKDENIIQKEDESRRNKTEEMDDDDVDDEEEKHSYNFVLDPYEEEFDIEDDPSIEEDYYEFLSQDGGSGAASENSYGGDEEINDELEEVRGAG